MSFLHCHTPGCYWEQDDFYSPDGYPLTYLKYSIQELCNLDNNLEEQYSDCSEFLAENGPISLREVIARDFEKFADRIRNMPWPTEEHWKRDKDKAVCPKCGLSNFNID